MTPLEEKKLKISQKNSFLKSDFGDIVGPLVSKYYFHPESELIAKLIFKNSTEYSPFSDNSAESFSTKNVKRVKKKFDIYCEKFNLNSEFFCVLPNVSIVDHRYITKFSVLQVDLNVLKICADLSM